MYKFARKYYKEIISRKILDWAEVLPKFQGGFINELQSIREHQKKWSSRRFQNRIKPDNSSLTLKEIRFVVSFQLEQFFLIQRIISKLFPNSEKVGKFIKDLKDSESSISACSWNNIGLVVKNKGFYVGESQVVDSLPKYVKLVHVSYHRIMPSLACLSFTFFIENEFSNELAHKQNCEYLPPVIFKSINPFKKFPAGYSMGSGNDVSKEVLRNHIYNLASTFNSWLESRLPLGKQSSLPKSIVERYELKGNPTEGSELTKWLKDNRGWFENYGLSTLEYDTFRSSNLLYSESSYPDKTWPVYTLTSLEDNEGEKERFVDFRMDSLAVAAAIFGILDNLQLVLEKHRMSGFQFLSKFDTKILNKTWSVSTIKRLSVILDRLQHEFTEGKHWILHSLAEINELKRTTFGKELNLNVAIIDHAIYRIDTIRKASNIIDIGLTGYLEVQNIYAMYRLQRWIFVLSIVVTLATIVSVLSGWNDLAKLWEKLLEWHNKLINQTA